MSADSSGHTGGGDTSRSDSEAARIDAAAGAWLARRQTESWSAADEAGFASWLEASTRHRIAWLRIEHGWERAERLKALKTPGAEEVPARGEWNFSPFVEPRQHLSKGAAPARPLEAEVTARRNRWKVLAAAASLLLTVGAALALYFWSAGGMHRTAVGGLETVATQDGSHITLNTATEIHLAFTPERRRVELDRGEALFEVAKDSNRPFVVQAGHRRVIAVGTRFSVRRDANDEMSVAVTEGKVRIETEEGGRTIVSGTLAAGTVAHAGAGGVLLRARTVPEIEETLSWRRGVLVFHETTLAQAVAEFNRYNTHKIVIDDAAIGELPVAGAFRATNADAFVRLVQRGFPVRVEERGDTTTLGAAR